MGMGHEDDAVLIPMDDVAWQNDMYMARADRFASVMTGSFSLSPSRCPSDKPGRATARKNPYTNRVETELLSVKLKPAKVTRLTDPIAAFNVKFFGIGAALLWLLAILGVVIVAAGDGGAITMVIAAGFWAVFCTVAFVAFFRLDR